MVAAHASVARLPEGNAYLAVPHTDSLSTRLILHELIRDIYLS